VTLAKTQAFGTNWTGSIEDISARAAAEEPRWKFQLHADHLDATELDRWFGPRGRPNWLQRLLPSLLGEKAIAAGGNTAASELLRRVHAVGDLETDTLSIEKLKFAHAKAHLELYNLKVHARDMECEWAGGTVRGSLDGFFTPKPGYDIAGEF